MTQAAFLGEIAWKGTILLAAAFAAAALLRRASAAARHFLWTEALAALLLLPVAILVAPQWQVQVGQTKPGTNPQAKPPAPPARGTVLVVRPNSARPFPAPWLWLWALGGAMASVRFAVGAARTRSILRRAKPADYAQAPMEEIARALGIRRRVVVLETAAAPVPLACRLFRPAIVLPGDAAEWTEARLHTVLRHELAHIRRWDLAAQAIGQAVCCLYWFHPLAWMASRRLRQEREGACDDALLAAGVPPHQYASDLVDLARGAAARRRAWADAPAMAEACDLESRVRGLFDGSRNRRPLVLRTALSIDAATLALLVAVASVALHAHAARGALAGIVQDPSGARVPFTRVVAKNQDGTNQEMTMCNPAGEYRFNAIPPGHYVLEAGAPGFALAKVNAVVTAGQATRVDVNLEMGTVTEAMTVRGQKPPTVTPRVGTPQRIRVGGMIQAVKLVQQVKPEYPADLQQLGVEGTVVIRAIISKDGDVLSPRVVNTDIDPRLAQIALDTVKQWRYQPSLLNGEPVETVTTVSIDFKLN